MQYSPLFARTVIIRENIGIAILSLELTSLPDREIRILKEILCEETGVVQENCFICVTHTFSAPHILPESGINSDEVYRKRDLLRCAIHKAAREAAAKARINLEITQLTIGQCECHINTNRDIETKEGWWISNCGTGLSDKTLTVICARTENGNPSLVLIHYAVQSSVLHGSILPAGDKAVSGDLAGTACMALEEQYPDSTVIFLLGAAGDQSPVEKTKETAHAVNGKLTASDNGNDGLLICRYLGEKLAESARQAIESSVPLKETEINCKKITFMVPGQRMPASLRELRPTRSYNYIPESEKQISVEALRIGHIVLLCVQPELNCITARQIADASPFDITLIMTMVNGSAKYMADTDSYDRFTYEAMNSPFGKGAAETMCDRVILLLKKICK